jgi:putative transcriptional regulator
MSDFFKSIQAGLNEAVEHQKNGNVKGARTHAFADIDIKKIRTKYDLSQSQFAQTFGLNVRNVQDWEQKKTTYWRIIGAIKGYSKKPPSCN